MDVFEETTVSQNILSTKGMSANIAVEIVNVYKGCFTMTKFTQAVGQE